MKKVLFVFLSISVLIFVDCSNSRDSSTTVQETTSSTSTTPLTFTLLSSAADGGFDDTSTIATEFEYNSGGQCSGDNNFPKLTWANVPSGTQSFVLIVEDPVGANWVHLNLYNIPSNTTSITKITSSGASAYTVTFSVGTLGTNSFNQINWGGPCPPSGSGKHTYYFKLYALSVSSISTLSKVTRSAFESAHSGHILGSSEITATAQKP